ncbi:pilus assembly protein TadG-related protein [Brevibacterium samyangense]|uniref:Putative Flp pilus-assembly TadG-like N-terminal domain-containing protein n=1 Tax=Brevibacterium samyangense TaxID=366888 RepID=A0ABN2T8P9_9MICO
MRRAIIAARRPSRSDEGSVLPLGIGFTTIALMLVFLAVTITDIALAQNRLRSLADSAALAATNSFVPADSPIPGILLTDEIVEDGAGAYLDAVDAAESFTDLDLRTRTDDGMSVSVELRARHSPVLLSPFVPYEMEIAATGEARGALRYG